MKGLSYFKRNGELEGLLTARLFSSSARRFPGGGGGETPSRARPHEGRVWDPGLPASHPPELLVHGKVCRGFDFPNTTLSPLV